MRRNLCIGAFLFAIALGVYGQTLEFPFIHWDDPLYITKNAHVQEGITVEGVAWAFGEPDFSNWHPLTWMSHMIDCEL